MNTIESTLNVVEKMLNKAYANDSLFQEIIDLKRKEERKLSKRLTKQEIKIVMRDLEAQENKIYFKRRL